MNVTLRRKKNDSGKISLYLDITDSGKRYKEYLGMSLYGRPKNADEKLHNQNQISAANKIRVEREKALQEAAHGVRVADYKQDFLKYFTNYKEGYTKKNKRMYSAVLAKLTDFIKARGIKKLTGRDITVLFCEDFAEYLKSKLNYETPYDYFQVFRKVVRRARKEKAVDIDLDDIKVKFTHDRQAIRKQILTIGEIDAMLKVTPPNKEVARAFIFCLNTGFDFATVKALTWKEIHDGHVVFDRGKTKRQNRIKLNETALELLGDRGKPSELIFTIPTWEGAVKSLRSWAELANIEKKLTWHSARHTLGAMLVNNYKVDIRVIQDIFGHSSLKPTTRYTRVFSETKDKALDNLPEMKLKH